MDDDPLVREALTSLLRSLGYAAVAFERAEDLLNSKRRRELSCVISDVQMPGMSGPELHARLVASGKPVPTIRSQPIRMKGPEHARCGRAWLATSTSRSATTSCSHTFARSSDLAKGMGGRRDASAQGGVGRQLRTLRGLPRSSFGDAPFGSNGKYS